MVLGNEKVFDELVQSHVNKIGHGGHYRGETDSSPNDELISATEDHLPRSGKCRGKSENDQQSEKAEDRQKFKEA